MPRSLPELFFVNILLSIDKIQRSVKSLSYRGFAKNEVIFGFVVRELQEIGESVKKLIQRQFGIRKKRDCTCRWVFFSRRSS